MSGGGNNATISLPGPHWQMLWVGGDGPFANFQLDIVGFLAVLGEGSVTANAQVSALSRLFYLPRLIPAPQALLPPSRPTELPSAKASVTGVISGNTKDHVHHVANILLGAELPAFAVRCVEVTKRKVLRGAPSRIDTYMRGQSKTRGRRVLTDSPEFVSPPVKAKATGPLSWVTLLGCFLSASLFIVSITFGDGMSLVATLLLSLLSSLIGLANKWSLKLPRRAPNDAPAGDVIIRYPNGSHLYVRCEEDVARELFFAPEEIDYNISSPAVYRIISLVGTLMLMLAVIALANAKLQLQFAWAGAYIIINIAHWVAAALPPKLHWDLSCYRVQEQGLETGPKCRNFTEALWKAIVLAKSTRWVRTGKAAPETAVWDEWLLEAEAQACLCGTHTGPLIDPIWPVDNPDKATIWNMPKHWDPKTAWNRISSEDREAERKGFVPTTRAA